MLIMHLSLKSGSLASLVQADVVIDVMVDVELLILHLPNHSGLHKECSLAGAGRADEEHHLRHPSFALLVKHEPSLRASTHTYFMFARS